MELFLLIIHEIYGRDNRMPVPCQETLSVLLPEELIQCFVQGFAYGYAKIDGWMVITLFDRTDRLPGYVADFCKLLLRQILSGACGL